MLSFFSLCFHSFFLFPSFLSFSLFPFFSVFSLLSFFFLSRLLVEVRFQIKPPQTRGLREAQVTGHLRVQPLERGSGSPVSIRSFASGKSTPHLLDGWQECTKHQKTETCPQLRPETLNPNPFVYFCPFFLAFFLFFMFSLFLSFFFPLSFLFPSFLSFLFSLFFPSFFLACSWKPGSR